MSQAAAWRNSCAGCFLLLLLPLVFLTVRPGWAQERGGDVGLGGQVGEPSGLSLKVYPRHNFAYTFLAATDFDDLFFLSGHGLYEYARENAPLRFYVGPGFFTGLDEDNQKPLFGTGALLGANFFLACFEVFMQAGPRLRLLPGTAGEIGWGVGLRYYFCAKPKP